MPVRPESVEIVSASERDKVISSPSALVSTIEFNEQESAKLLCRSAGSAPAARLSWKWRVGGSGRLHPPDLPDVHLLAESSSAGQVGFSSSSLIEVRNLDARFHLAELWCTASVRQNDDDGGAAELTAKVQLLVKCEYANKKKEPLSNSRNNHQRKPSEMYHYKQRKQLELLI